MASWSVTFMSVHVEADTEAAAVQLAGQRINEEPDFLVVDVAELPEEPVYNVKLTAPGAWLVYTHGQPPIEGTAVYRYDNDHWVCENHPHQGTEYCDHIRRAQQ